MTPTSRVNNNGKTKNGTNKMLFNSYIFILFFLPLSLWGYFFFSKKEEGKKNTGSILWLALCSLWFYCYATPLHLAVILPSIFINYGSSLLIRKRVRENKSTAGLFSIALVLQLGILFFFKYTNFFLDLTWEYHHLEERLSLVLPLGISFFTFSQISFLIDSKRGEMEEPSFMEYLVYVTWFPKLTMGPIMTFSEFSPLLRDEEKRKPDVRNISEGLYTFALGLAKKVLIADTLGKIVAIGFLDVYVINSMTALITMVSYTLQIYFDFSGYCDMAVGIGRMFNLTVPENFNSPYKALSITDFWKRWHMTLTSFFTRYLYIPLGGNRKGKIVTYRNIFLVFLVSGLWHGANMTFVLWGAIHGFFMVMERAGKDLVHRFKKKKIAAKEVSVIVKATASAVTLIRWCITFTIINVTWVLFRSESVERFSVFMEQLTSGGWQPDPRITELFLDLIEIRLLKRAGLQFLLDQYPVICLWILLAALAGFCVLFKNRREKTPIKSFNWVNSITVMILLLWCIFSLSDITTFLYFEF